jgi:lipoprotein-releasing system ATP-binding protein
LLEAKNIHKAYKNGKRELQVLKGIDLKVEKGEFISVFGPSGAGKSTLLHILGGLDKPTEGNVILDKQDLYKLAEKKRAGIRNKKVGFVFQFYHLLPEFSAVENVMLPALIGGCRVKGVGCRGMAEELLEVVGLKDRASHRPGELSGGQQQRVAIARALVNRPGLLLCDEPTGNLDSVSGKGIIDLLDRLNKEEKTTIVVVTHEEEIARRADRVMHIKDGKLN